MTSNTPTRKLKILMLHGFTQSGPLFQTKTQSLKKALTKSFSAVTSISDVELIYPTAPIPLSVADIPGLVPSADGSGLRDEAYGWWRMPDHTTGGHRAPYIDLDKGLGVVASVLREQGPFDGVIGFSQGAGLAAMVASLLEASRKEIFTAYEKKIGMAYPSCFVGLDHPPLKFAVAYAGFVAENETYAAFYEPRIETPLLSLVGSLDTVVEESWTARLMDCCTNGKTALHPGGHFVPGGKKEIAVVVDFVKQAVLSPSEGAKEEEDDDVLNMDMPF